ncbi:MAG: glutaredoxin family protein [Thioalkalivibrionaceae bacterium]
MICSKKAADVGGSTAPSVRVYHRDGCFLCDELLEAVATFLDRYTFRLETIDIDEDPALLARFNAKVPVVEVDGDILCCHRLDVGAFDEALRDAQKLVEAGFVPHYGPEPAPS